MGGFLLLFLCVFVRLVDVQIVQSEELTQRGVRQWTRSGTVAARRGDIVDTNGKLLAQSITSLIVSARVRDVGDVDGLASVLERELGIPAERTREKLRGSKAAAVTLARQVSREDADRLRALMAGGEDAQKLRGIAFDEDVSRWYPMGNSLAQVLGLCNVDGEGQSGLELRYNEVLSGEPGRIVTEVDARARTLPDGVTLYVPAQAGSTLRLTIDREVQATVERAVRECVQVNEAQQVQAIVMDVNTGAVLAMAMAPTYDPADPPREDVAKLNELMRITTLSDVYEPGSTFKMLTAAAAIDCGATNPQEGFYCSGRITVNGSTVRCWGAPHGAQTMRRALENSCNPVFTQLALRLGSDRLYQYLHAFGLGRRTGIDLYGEAAGILIPRSRVKDVDLARIGFGQSVAVTPLQMITAACAVVNGGRLMKPYLVEAILDADGRAERVFSPKVVSNPISAQTSATMRELLGGVVAEGGGKNARVDGWSVGGKTGTAQIYKNGKIETNLHIGSFVGFAPVEEPKVAVLVIVNEAQVKPDYGGTTAAPFAAQIFSEILPLLGVPKTDGSAQRTQVTVPDVTGMTVRDARTILRERGIDSVTDGTDSVVTGQLPPAGTRVQEGFCAMLYVSGESAPTAQEYTQVPNVIGLPVRESAQALREAGLALYAQGDGIAVKQSPAAGTYAAAGNTVTVEYRIP
ncbi:MAG: penicillin-binding transpeptidase domain-containing protein [Christensenellales bacterium]|nr:penicillin-binding transpeptidase domain-containing protein [Christensenellales bacterium]